MTFRPVYYMITGWPSLEQTKEMVRRYVEHGVTALQFDMPAADPSRESQFIQDGMRHARALYGPGHDVFMDALRDIRREFPARPTPPATEPWATALPYPARSSPWSGSLPISHKVSANSPKPLHENVQKMPAFCYRYTHYLRKCLCHKNLWVPAALLLAAKITFNVSIKGLSLLPA